MVDNEIDMTLLFTVKVKELQQYFLSTDSQRANMFRDPNRPLESISEQRSEEASEYSGGDKAPLISVK